MTNSATTPPSGGGMPKWLIVLLVMIIILVLGCGCGFVACNWMCHAATTGIQSAAQRGEAEFKAEQQREAEAAKKQAEQQGGNTATPEPMPGGNPGSADGGNGGNAGTGGNAGGTTPQRTMAEELGTGKIPANFPKDIPLMSGLTPTGLTTADKVKGSGMGVFTGKVKHDDLTAYYEKQMVSQGWKIETNQDIGDATTMTFSKDNRKATIVMSLDADKQSAFVNISYEKTQ